MRTGFRGERKTDEVLALWTANGIAFALSALNTIFWGYSIKAVGKFQLTLNFLLRLGTNPWFILAMATALSSTVITYFVISAIGIAKGRLFLTTGSIAVVITSYLVFGEYFTYENMLGVALVLIGAALLV